MLQLLLVMTSLHQSRIIGVKDKDISFVRKFAAAFVAVLMGEIFSNPTKSMQLTKFGVYCITRVFGNVDAIIFMLGDDIRPEIDVLQVMIETCVGDKIKKGKEEEESDEKKEIEEKKETREKPDKEEKKFGDEDEDEQKKAIFWWKKFRYLPVEQRGLAVYSYHLINGQLAQDFGVELIDDCDCFWCAGKAIDVVPLPSFGYGMDQVIDHFRNGKADWPWCVPILVRAFRVGEQEIEKEIGELKVSIEKLRKKKNVLRLGVQNNVEIVSTLCFGVLELIKNGKEELGFKLLHKAATELSEKKKFICWLPLIQRVMREVGAAFTQKKDEIGGNNKVGGKNKVGNNNKNNNNNNGKNEKEKIKKKNQSKNKKK